MGDGDVKVFCLKRMSLKKLKIHSSVLLKSGIKKLFPYYFRNLILARHLAVVIITHRCNFKCLMCAPLPHVSKSESEFDRDKWKSVIAQIGELGIGDIHFTGGEPLLREDLCELIRYAKDLKFNVGVTTNGSLLTKAFLEKLISAGLGSMAISIDALGKDYENIRGVPNFYAKTEEALKLLSRYKIRSKIKGYINFTLMRSSLPHFRAVKAVADGLNLPVAICLLDYTPYFFSRKANKECFWMKDESSEELNNFIRFLKNEKKEKPKSLIINKTGIRYIENYFYDPVQPAIPCVASQTRIFINPYGKVMGGCLSMGSFGDLKESSLKEIIRGSRLKQKEKDMFYKKCPGCSCGYIYNLQHYLPAISKDFLRL